MAVLPITWEHDSLMAAELIENGADDLRWTLAADARIKTDVDPVGVGPVAFKGRPKDNDGNIDLKSGLPRDALFIFYTDTEARRGGLEGVDPDDLTDTINDFLANHGGDRDAMLALVPAVT